MKEKGFILLGMLFMLVLIAVTAVALNRRAGLQNRMAANQARAVRTQFNQEAAMEEAVWKLTKDPCWRTSDSGEDYIFNGITYNRKVLASTVSGYTDAVTVSVTASPAAKPAKTSYRYYINTIFLVKKPNQICCDTMNNIYFADSDNHSILRMDATTGAITRVAGNGNSGASGDGGPATSATLNAPKGVFVDSAGNIYIADTNNHRIRKVDTFDNISTVAGLGFPGSWGDGGPATIAMLNRPHGVFANTSGDIYIADTENHCIRKVDADTQIISTVAGIRGSGGFSGDGGPATSAKLNRPHGVFANTSGDIYIADTENHCIRKVDADNQIINTVAGIGGSGGFSGDGGPAAIAYMKGPCGIFVNTSGEIYISDTDNNRIRKFVEGGNINTVAGNGTAGYSGDGGPATSAELDHPKGVCLNNSAEVIITDTNNGCVRKVDNINEISTFDPAVGPGFNRPAQIAIYDNVSEGKYYLFIADKNNHRIRKLDITTGSIMAVAGTGTLGFSGDTDPATNAELNNPEGVSVDTSGNIYIADTENHCIRKVDADTQIIDTVAGIGGSSGFSGDGDAATSAELREPQGVFVDASGNIYIADTENHCIRKVDADTQIIDTVAGIGESGGFSGDGGPAASAKLKRPHGVFANTSGDIYIADSDNHRIRKVDAMTQIINTIAGTGSGGFSGDGGLATDAKLRYPGGVFVDSAENIFISDTQNNRLRVVSDHDAKINTIAGTGWFGGFNGDAQPAVTAKLNKPSAVAMAVTRGGAKIYISDTENNRIRMLNFKRVKGLY